MSSQPCAETQIWDEINSAVQRMNPEQGRMWESTKVIPEKWNAPNYGAGRQRFWAVAVMGQTVVWYDDIEDGFAVTEYLNFGAIAGSSSGDMSLERAIQELINRLSSVSTVI
jgi:hypothetical protein